MHRTLVGSARPSGRRGNGSGGARPRVAGRARARSGPAAARDTSPFAGAVAGRSTASHGARPDRVPARRGPTLSAGAWLPARSSQGEAAGETLPRRCRTRHRVSKGAPALDPEKGDQSAWLFDQLVAAAPAEDPEIAATRARHAALFARLPKVTDLEAARAARNGAPDGRSAPRPLSGDRGQGEPAQGASEGCGGVLRIP